VEIKNVRAFVLGFFCLERHGKFDSKLKSSNKCLLPSRYTDGKYKKIKLYPTHYLAWINRQVVSTMEPSTILNKILACWVQFS